MKTITLLFWNEDQLGRELNTHTLEFTANVTTDEELYDYINKTYWMLLDNFSYYSIIEEHTQDGSGNYLCDCCNSPVNTEDWCFTCKDYVYIHKIND